MLGFVAKLRLGNPNEIAWLMTRYFENYDLVLQPETRPISQEQLVAEVKGIYAGLIMVEAKCIEFDSKPHWLKLIQELSQN